MLSCAQIRVCITRGIVIVILQAIPRFMVIGIGRVERATLPLRCVV